MIRAHMTASAVGPFSQSFEWELGGAAEPVRLTIHGRAVPPLVKVWFTPLRRGCAIVLSDGSYA